MIITRKFPFELNRNKVKKVHAFSEGEREGRREKEIEDWWSKGGIDKEEMHIKVK